VTAIRLSDILKFSRQVVALIPQWNCLGSLQKAFPQKTTAVPN